MVENIVIGITRHIFEQFQKLFVVSYCVNSGSAVQSDRKNAFYP